MALQYVFGPVTATDTVLNINVQFHRVRNRNPEAPEFGRGWGWSTDDDDLSPDNLLEVDSQAAINDLLRTLRERLEEEVDGWKEEHPKAAAAEEATMLKVGR